MLPPKVQSSKSGWSDTQSKWQEVTEREGWPLLENGPPLCVCLGLVLAPEPMWAESPSSHSPLSQHSLEVLCARHWRRGNRRASHCRQSPSGTGQ